MMRGRTLVALAVAAVALALPAPPTRSSACTAAARSSAVGSRSRSTAPAPRPGSVSLYVERQRAPAAARARRHAAARRRPGPARDLRLQRHRRPLRRVPRPHAAQRHRRLRRARHRALGPAALPRARTRQPDRRRRGGRRLRPAARAARAASTARSDSVDDIEAVRAALGVDKLTLIGVSYGTFLAQAYAARYPTHVDRVLLDSVLDVSGWDPFYLDIFGAVPRVLRAVCRRTCAQLHRRPRGRPRPAGHAARQGARCAARDVCRTAAGGARPHPPGAALHARRRATSTSSARRVPGAVMSALRGDSAPILRLERHAVFIRGLRARRASSAPALYAATACEEIPFPWTRFSRPPRRFGADRRPRSLRSPTGALPVRPRHDRGQRLHPHVPPLARGLAGALRGARAAAGRAGADAVRAVGPAHPERGGPQRGRRLAARAGADGAEHRPLGADGGPGQLRL